MAIYRCETKILSRRVKDKAGKVVPNREHSAIESAAYRACEKLKDQRQDKTFNYAPRAREVAHSEVMTPEGAPPWLRPTEAATRRELRQLRERLWNAVEKRERRSDSQLCREFLLTMPRELTLQQNIELVRGWCEQEIVSKGFVADINLHRSRKGDNPHAHVLCTLRPVAADGFGLKPKTDGKFNRRGSVGVGAKDDLLHWRETWCHHENAALEKAGRAERVDHRSLKDQGIDRVPEPKVGANALAMQREGKVEVPDAVKRLHQVKILNQILPHLRAFERGEHIHRFGQATEWWQRARSRMAAFAARAREGIASPSFWRNMVGRTREAVRPQPRPVIQPQPRSTGPDRG